MPGGSDLIVLDLLAGAAPPQNVGHVAEILRLTVLGKLLLATLLGGAIGLERELAGKPAGLRTNILICVGAALFMQLSIDVAEIGFSPDGHPFGDTTRIAAQIVSGIGFLGAGAILHSEGAVVGLTTAATVWVVAAIGASVGAGAYVDALGSTALIILVLIGLRPVEHRLLTKRRKIHAIIRIKPGVSFSGMEKILSDHGLHVAGRHVFEHDTDRAFELDLIGPNSQLERAIETLRANKDVISAVSE